MAFPANRSIFVRRGYFERATSATISVVGKNGTRLRLSVGRENRNTSSRVGHWPTCLARRDDAPSFLVFSRIIRAQRKSRSLLFHGSDRILFAFDDDEFFLKKGSFLLASCSSISEREYHCTSSSYLRKFCLTCFKIIRMDARHSASLIQGYLGLRDHG